METIVPAEIGMPTLRTAEVDLVQSNKALEINLDLLEEIREQVAIRDIMYRNNEASRAEDAGKLGPNGKDHMRLRKHLEKEHTS
ncbi:hypothetical protein Tco_0017373 [Tanacetum coccineum]